VKKAYLVSFFILGTIILTLPTISFANICDRSKRVRYEITKILNKKNCTLVKDSDLLKLHYLRVIITEELKSFDFEGLHYLEKLVLNSRKPRTLPEGVFRGLKNLYYLDLQLDLETVPEGIFQGLESLSTLGIGRKGFSSKPLQPLPEGVFQGLSSLRTLYLSGNKLHSLPEGIFQGLPKLYYLSLGANELQTLPEGLFRGLDNLGILGLDTNQLQTLPEGIFHRLYNLHLLDLRHNQFSELEKEKIRENLHRSTKVWF